MAPPSFDVVQRFQDLRRVLDAERPVLEGHEHDLPLAVEGDLHPVPLEDGHHLVGLRHGAPLGPEALGGLRPVELQLVGRDGHEGLPAAEAGGGELHNSPLSVSAARAWNSSRLESFTTVTSARASTSDRPQPLSLESLASNSSSLPGASSLPRFTSLS